VKLTSSRLGNEEKRLVPFSDESIAAPAIGATTEAMSTVNEPTTWTDSCRDQRRPSFGVNPKDLLIDVDTLSLQGHHDLLAMIN